MPDTENTENNTETITCVNMAHVMIADQNRQSPEMTHPHSNAQRHSSPANVSLVRFDPSAHRSLSNSASLVENISARIEGLRPLVERVRSYPRISSFFNIQRHRREVPTTSNSGDSYIINIEEAQVGGTEIATSTPHEEHHCQLHNRRGTQVFPGNEAMGGTSAEAVNADDDVNNEETSVPDGAVNAPTEDSEPASAPNLNEADGNNNNNSEESSIADNMLISEDLQLSPEMRALLQILKRYVPYVLILLIKIVYDHIEGIMILLLFLGTFIRVNTDLKREIAKQQNRSWSALARILFHIMACFVFVSLIFGEDVLPFISEPVTMLDLLWSVAVMDFSLKLVTVVIKVAVTSLPTGLLAIPKRGKYYLLVEATSQVCRCCAPIRLWLFYLYKAYKGPEMIFGLLLSIAYVVSKTSDIISRVSLFWTAATKLLQNMSLGVAPSKDQLVASGGVCAICHEEYSTPVKLTCKHIFCEACVSTWLDRERSCPLCRASISDDPIYRDGHTTHFIQLY